MQKQNRLFFHCLALLTTVLTGCVTPPEPMGAARKELVFGVTASHELVQFNAGQPQRILKRLPITGLASGDQLVGMDYRIAKGVLFALSRAGRLYTLDTVSGALQPVATTAPLIALNGTAFGLDFNPAADRIRVVSNTGQNLRLHPDLGTAVDGDAQTPGLQPDGQLTYAKGDANEGKSPQLVAAAYTYNKQDDKITTNYALDRALGQLVMQGSREGAVPVVSPNAGQLRSVGSLGIGPLDDAAFDIADTNGAALAAIRTGGSTRLYEIDLGSGKAKLLGSVGNGGALLGMAIEP